jgi:aromatic-amino-acid transaminase
MAEYRYFDAQTRGVDVEGMLADLGQVAAGDIVLLHGCCHNPTGANLNLVEWAAVANLLVAKGAIPLIDLAYQGFGDGLEADAAPTRTIAACCPEVLIAASCSKNFGIYRERTGLLIGLGSSAQRGLIQGNLAFLNRQNYSFPPDHGARLVTMILEDPALTTVWRQELEEIRLNMLTLRQSLAMELRRLTGSDRWGFIAQHRGMFSRLGATEAEVARMRAERGIYMVSDSRLNIAGLNAATVPVLAQAIADIVA